MTAFNVVRFRVKPDREAEFLEKTRVPGYEVKSGLRHAWLIKTGERSYCLIGQWDSMDAIVAARPDMLADLDLLRPTLEDLGGGRGVTEAISGEVVADHLPDE